MIILTFLAVGTYACSRRLVCIYTLESPYIYNYIYIYIMIQDIAILYGDVLFLGVHRNDCQTPRKYLPGRRLCRRILSLTQLEIVDLHVHIYSY